MEIKIPKNSSNNETLINNKKSIVLIGANGSGKTRMSLWIEENNSNTFRISAQKSLSMPNKVPSTDIESALTGLYFGYEKVTPGQEKWTKNNYRWKDITFLNDFDKLMIYLFSEHFEKSIEYRDKHLNGDNEFCNKSNLETIKEIWEKIINHRQLKIEAGRVIVLQKDNQYICSELSDGEREVFYFLGEVLSAPKNSIIIIDEPENHLHDLILNELWNNLEQLREDCTFVYITHKIDFATSRNNSQIIWVKDYKGNNNWDYLLVEGTELPHDLYLTILGSRKNVMLVEGDYDYRIYSIVFNSYNIIKVNNCENIINYVKAFNAMNDIHYIQICGIIDRDRRKKEILESYKHEKIYSLKINEIENLLLIPEIITCVARRLGKNDDEIETIIKSAKENVLNKFSEQKEQQILEYVKEDMRNNLNKIFTQKKEKISDFIEYYESNAFHESNIQKIYDEYDKKFSEIIRTSNFDEALVYFSNKGLLNISKVLEKDKLGITKNTYVDVLIDCLKTGDIAANTIKSYINMD